MKNIKQITQPLLGLLAALALCAAAAGAHAQVYTVTVSPAPALELGAVVAAASGVTVFHIDAASGSATVTSGSGRRTSTGAVQALVTIGCDLNGGRGVDRNACNGDNVPITIGSIGLATGRAQSLRNFNVSMVSARMAGSTSGSNPLQFNIGPPGAGRSVSFYVGADFPVAGDDSAAPSGNGYANFYVNVGSNSNAQDVDAQGHVRVYRSVSLSKTADLSFGLIIRPTTGNATVSLSAASGLRTVSGSGAGLPGSTPTAASFSAAGEGGQALSVTVPSSFTMTGPATITVTTNTTASGAPTLSGSAGAAGAYSFAVGGSFPISASTPTGAYSGVLTVSVDYN